MLLQKDDSVKLLKNSFSSSVAELFDLILKK